MRRNETDPIGAAGGGEFLPAGSPEVDFTDLSSLEDDTEGIQDPQAGAEPEEPQQSDAAAQPQASDVEPPQDRAAPAAAPQGRVPQVNIPGLTPEDIQTVCQQYDVDPGFVEAVLSLGRKQMAQEFATSGVALQ